MARGMNHVFLIGTLARDAELRYTQGDNPLPILEATVAGEDHIVSHDGRSLQLPWYHRAGIVGKQAEWLSSQNLVAGTAVLVEGTLEYRSWDDPNGGGKRSIVQVKARRIDKLGYDPEIVNDRGGGVRMRGGMNEVRLVGNVTRNAELRQTAGGAVLSLGLAVNESWYDRNREIKEKVHWIDVKMWREMAERYQGIQKGDPVMITGRLVNDSWQDKEGNKRNTTRVEATRVEVLARGATANNNGQAATPVTTQLQQPEATQFAQGQPAISAAAVVEQRADNANYPAPAPASYDNSNRSQSGELDIENGLVEDSEGETLPF